MNEPIDLLIKDRIACVTLNRPKRKNTLSYALLSRLHNILSDEIPTDTIAVIITGANNCFSAGADISELKGTLDDMAMDDAIEAVTERIQSLPIPVIAALDGPCMGGAFDLAVTCDVRIASHSAFFQVPATRLGLLYSPRAVARIQKKLGRDNVFRLLVMGERFDAKAAFASGIVSEVTKTESSMEAALALAERSRENVDSAVATTKALLNAIDVGDIDENGQAAFWQEERKKHLSTTERKQAIEKAHLRFLKE
jgi:enoyl-CoA hydratase